ncbi:MAG: long-chain fatty acid--CoA ligase [Alphaproteobacteria bacterium]|nr:long-chain fatty acid--CoA ligase [Alphaproteobacteria bacterium]
MQGLMMETPLLLTEMIRFAAECHGEVEVVARDMDDTIHRYTYAQAHDRTKRLAQASKRLGIRFGDVVGALGWNTHRYFELFYGISGTGAVLHTINPRLFEAQLVYIINHAEDRWLFIDTATIELAERLAPQLETVEGYVFMGPEATMPESVLPNLQCYETLLAAEDGEYEWPEFDERTASTICYTSGTTGDPKGVVYSHRSSWLSCLHLSSRNLGGDVHDGEAECWMPMAGVFHANGWFIPYIAPMNGYKLVMTGRNYEPEKLYELVEGEGVTMCAGVPTIWLMLANYLKESNLGLSTLKTVLMSGSKPPRVLIDMLEKDFDVRATEAWGMTEVIGATRASLRPGEAALGQEAQLDRRELQGRRAFGTRYRLIDDAGDDLPHDGAATGHLLVKGAIVASGYWKSQGIVGETGVDADGWLHTGDVARLHGDGYIELADRSKDVIKSGGEWISSVTLENTAMGHPDVREAAVIGAAHPKWQERPLLIVVRREGAAAGAEEILAYMAERVASWWLPDDVVFVDELPYTATGKVHKLRLRETFADYRLPNIDD